MSSTIDNEVMSESNGELFVPLQGGLRWHTSAPERIVTAGSWDNDSEGWTRWREHLSERDDRKPIGRLFKHDQLSKPPLAKGESETTLTAWVDEASANPTSREQAEELLAVARQLPELAARVSARLWWRTLECLLNARQWAESQDWQRDVVAGQLLLAELPATLAYALPELDNTRWLVPSAIEHVRASMAELFDGQGLPHASHLNSFRPLVASWARVAKLSRSLERADWNDEMQKELSAAIIHLLRLSRRDGSQVLSDEQPRKSQLRWIEDAADEFGSRKSRHLAAFVLRHHGKLPSKSPPAADHSEWSELATLRTDWTRRAKRLTVDYSSRRIRAELDIAGELIFSGSWAFEVQFNGQVLEQQSDWEEVCWESDEEIDYLELQTTVTHGVKIQRQFMLSRSDDILVMADAVLGNEPGELEYRASYPLAAGMTFEGADESREGYLVGKKRRALVMPLAMPEWRADPRGTLHVVDGQLEVLQSATKAKSLFAPLFFDLRSQRFEKRRTWRRLTIGEERAIAGPDAAVGYRAQVGKLQWVVFRALQPGRSRTVLGHHLFSEFLVGRFTSEGTVEALIEIE